MFDISFGEMMIIGMIILLFVDPKDLPRVARTIARFVNDLKQSGQQVRKSLLGVTDSLEKERRSILETLEKTANRVEEDLKPAMQSVKSSVEKSMTPPVIEKPVSAKAPSDVPDLPVGLKRD